MLADIDVPGASVHSMLGKAQRSVTSSPETVGTASLQVAQRQVADLAGRRHWDSKAGAAARRGLVDALVVAHSLDHADVADLLDDYAEAAERLARSELDWVVRGDDPDTLAERVVVGTMLGDAVLTALRRLAQAQESARRFGRPSRGG